MLRFQEVASDFLAFGPFFARSRGKRRTPARRIEDYPRRPFSPNRPFFEKSENLDVANADASSGLSCVEGSFGSSGANRSTSCISSDSLGRKMLVNRGIRVYEADELVDQSKGLLCLRSFRHSGHRCPVKTPGCPAFSALILATSSNTKSSDSSRIPSTRPSRGAITLVWTL